MWPSPSSVDASYVRIPLCSLHTQSTLGRIACIVQYLQYQGLKQPTQVHTILDRSKTEDPSVLVATPFSVTMAVISSDGVTSKLGL